MCLVLHLEELTDNRDGVGGKPWVDKSNTAARDFWSAVDKWFPTWGTAEDHSMTVKSVKMWQEGTCA